MFEEFGLLDRDPWWTTSCLIRHAPSGCKAPPQKKEKKIHFVIHAHFPHDANNAYGQKRRFD
jgi:hypothetical protein